MVEEFDGIVVIGSGLVGSLAALTLHRRGFDVKVYEKVKDWRLSTGLGSPEEKNCRGNGDQTRKVSV